MLAGVKQVGPELGFHDDCQLRTDAVQKSRHCTRQVIRGIHMRHLVTEQRGYPRRTRRRYRGYQDAPNP